VERPSTLVPERRERAKVPSSAACAGAADAGPKQPLPDEAGAAGAGSRTGPNSGMVRGIAVSEMIDLFLNFRQAGLLEPVSTVASTMRWPCQLLSRVGLPVYVSGRGRAA